MWSDEKIEWQQEEDEFGFGSSNRMLGLEESDYGEEVYDEKDAIPVVYSILLYGILTLYLILFVEFMRHNIDHVRRGRPFFTAVLTMVYSELATLGIVELGVFLWMKYASLGKEMKKKFADVHFALFLTAIFNALQYSLTSIVSARISNGLWVKTEQLELDHYVEIREEYERVQEIIDLQNTGCGKWVRNFILFVCRPGLRRRHESLRVQVRFHELRLYFLESNSLSFSLKVSDYLKRSELSILIGLVNVSAITWILLIGILNLSYFICGMIGYTTSNPGIIQKGMKIIPPMIWIASIVLSFALKWKMRQIFQTVMKTKVIEKSDHEEGIRNQKQLFWFGSPTVVISMIQLMNFGFALLFSIFIIYWKDLNSSPDRAIETILVISVGCYIVFLYNLSALLPEYTLCTSLGYLTNRKELHETVATHRLEEAERQRRNKMIENATVNDSTIFRAHPAAKSDSEALNTNGVGLPNVLLPVLESSIDKTLPDDKYKKTPLLVSDLVKIDTKALRRNLPEESRESLLNREERMRQRRLNRKKSVSDGVAAMRAWNQESGTSIFKETNEITKRNPTRRSRIKKTTSQPGVIQGWRNITVSEQQSYISNPLDNTDAARIGIAKSRRKSSSDPQGIKAWKESLLLENGKTNIKAEGPALREKDSEITKDSNENSTPKWKKDRLNRLEARRQARKRSQSASATIQSWQQFSTNESQTKNHGVIPDENYNSSDLRALSSDDGSDDNALTSKMKTNRFYGEIDGNQTPFVKREFNLSTLKETEDHSQLSPCLEDNIGAISGTNMILDLSHAVIIDNGKDCDDDGNNTIDTDKSIGNLSDIDVIQGETLGMVSHRKKSSRSVETDISWYAVMTREVRLYFMGSIYPIVSHFVGTSIAFFLIGHRVDEMLEKKAHTSNNIESSKREIALFWLEASFFLWFIIGDIIILVLFPCFKCKTEAQGRLGIATIIDIIIVGAVMMLFFFAEAQRCCTKQSEGNSSGSLLEDYDDVDEDYTFQTDCTCPIWGARTYGGLGKIEPLTSLILLRLFRFQLAHFLINSFNNKRAIKETTNDLKSDMNTQYEAKYSDHDDQICDGRHDNHENISGSALELWERAIADFPDIVQKYGQFSGELLQAMLGLEVVMESSDISISAQLGTRETKEGEMQNLSNSESKRSHIQLAQSRYAKLPPRAQGIIIAGSLRKPVKPMHFDVHEKCGIEPSSALLSRTGLVDFEIDIEQMHSEHNTAYTFVAPFARLVRSMRRCDRRHFPLLKEWISVDVVMTQFEIVYFEAIDIYGSYLDEKTRLHCDACRLALKATKGGKNLRLCDVALGRKVVGHLDFADVTEVHVAKDDVPLSDMTLLEKAAVSFDKEQDLDVEHWSNVYCENEANQKYARYARIIRWTLTQEERLRISTNSGTLYFRFYSDLAHFEAENSGEPSKNIHAIARDIAFQWAETISRICGRSQLKQNLPHFGEENEAELRDYLEVVHFHEKEAENERKNNILGVQNVGNVELLFVGTKERGSAKKVKHERIKSMVEFATSDMDCSNVLQEEAFSTFKLKHRSVKSMTELGDERQPRQNKLNRKHLPFGKELNSADEQV